MAATALGLGGCTALLAAIDDDNDEPLQADAPMQQQPGNAAAGASPTPVGEIGDPSMRWLAGSVRGTPICVVAVVDQSEQFRRFDPNNQLGQELADGISNLNLAWAIVTFGSSADRAIPPASPATPAHIAALIDPAPPSLIGTPSAALRSASITADQVLESCPDGHITKTLLVTASRVTPITSANPDDVAVVAPLNATRTWSAGEVGSTTVLNGTEFGEPGQAVAEALRSLGLAVDVEVNDNTTSGESPPRESATN